MWEWLALPSFPFPLPYQNPSATHPNHYRTPF